MTTFSIKSILAVSLALIMSIMISTAGAVVSSTTVSGCSLYKKSLGQCTVFVDGLLKGLGNVSKNPTAFTATMFQISGRIFCKNPAGNSIEGQGVPFQDFEVSPIEDGQAINPATLTKNGKTLSEIAFHDPRIIQALADAGFTVSCQHSNWIQVIVVTKMQVMGQQISDPNPSTTSDDCNLPATGPLTIGGCDIDDTLRVSCRIQDPYFNDPASAIGVKNYDYGNADTGTGNCTEICHSTDPTQCSLTAPSN
jgi:hypothetical protein